MIESEMKTEYDVYHVGISGGKDSTALLLWAVHESGYPKNRIMVTFADTGNEAQQTYDYIQMLSDKVHPVITLKPDRDFYELAKHKKRFPSTKARFCTTELKLVPSKRHVDALKAQGKSVLMLSGVRAAESEDTAKLPAFEPWYASGYFECDQYRPLLSWKIQDVWAIHERYGIPRNPLYDMGCQRVGCLPCIMSRKKEIANIAQAFPERLDMIRKAEAETGNGFSGFFSYTKIPPRYRQTLVTVRGGQMYVASVDDVVAWATNDPDLHTEELDLFDEVAPACDTRWGACE